MILLLVALSAFFSASETALISLSKFRVRFLYENKKQGILYVRKLKEFPHRMFITILIGNNITAITASALATSLAYDLLGHIEVGLVAGIMTILILVFGDITPKTLAHRYNESIALRVAPIIWHLSILFTPVITLWEVIEKLVATEGKKPFITEEELKTIIKEGGKEGTIKEAEMIHRIFALDDISVKEVMIPKSEIIAVDENERLLQVVKLFTETGHAQFPVYSQEIDTIKGIVFVKDVLTEKDHNLPVTRIMRKPYVVAETEKLDQLLKQFQKRKRNIAFVNNDQGNIVGIITNKDIIQEIVGEMIDETEHKEPDIHKIGSRTWRILGKAEIQTINQALSLALQGEEHTTFGAYVQAKLGRIPKTGEDIDIDGLSVKILSVDDLHITRIVVRKKSV
ncbi:HlyC/CorC family transporter [Candidatus Woesearchaeota archaeon]|nr:HlyC/CorC family transporter [Candidatus Woesearchaeota archaeon]